MGNLLLVIIIIALAVFYFWAISPHMDRKRRRKCLAYAEWDYAHRGLWDMEQQIPENSLPAFARAIREKAAIELDVHITKDKQKLERLPYRQYLRLLFSIVTYYSRLQSR